MRKLFPTLLSICFLFLLADSASACLCNPESPKKAFAHAKKRASVIFAGQAVEVVNGFSTGQFRGWRATFKVMQYWKGAPGGEVVVITGPDNCAAHFEAGKEYLVFAYVPEGEQELSTSVCMQTGPLQMNGDNLKRLGKGKVLNKQSAALSNHGKPNARHHRRAGSLIDKSLADCASGACRCWAASGNRRGTVN